ncbi:MAG: FkbM family methyltransferase, partial [Comamonadaceae bacterium]
MQAVKRAVKALLQRSGYRLAREGEAVPYPYLDVLDVLLHAKVLAGQSPYFVQIGANDGQTGDPLHHLVDRYSLSGLLVEPQPDVYARLLRNCSGNPRLQFANALVGPGGGCQTLYVPKVGDLVPERLGQAASQDRRQLEAVLTLHFQRTNQREALARLPDLIVPIQVPCMPIETLLDRHGVSRVDLLVLDTMGYDFQILQQYPFSRSPPEIIHFEHRLLPRQEHRHCCEFLGERGYRLCMVEM